MTEIQGKSILARVSARFELARVRVIGSRLYCFNKRLEHYVFNIRVFLSLSMLGVIVGEDSLLWRVSSQP